MSKYLFIEHMSLGGGLTAAWKEAFCSELFLKYVLSEIQTM